MYRPTELVQGALDLLILKTVSIKPEHGWAIGRRIQHVSREALHWIKSERRTTESGRIAKFHALNGASRRQLEKGLASWMRLSPAMNPAQES